MNEICFNYQDSSENQANENKYGIYDRMKWMSYSFIEAQEDMAIKLMMLENST